MEPKATTTTNEAKATEQGAQTKPTPTKAEQKAKKDAAKALAVARAQKNAAKAKGTTAPANAPEAKTKTTRTDWATIDTPELRTMAIAKGKTAEEAEAMDRTALLGLLKTKPAKEPKAKAEPVWATQLDEHGQPEQVDRNAYRFEVKCAHPGCNEVRFVTLSGLKEVTLCKPHARKERRARRVNRLKDRARNHKAIVDAAIKQGLFPEAFRKKWGI